MAGKLLVIGAGGHGKVVADSARAMRCWEEIGFLDARWPAMERLGSWPVVGRESDVLAMTAAGDHVFVAIGSWPERCSWIRRIAEAGRTVAIVRHPSAIVSEDAVIGHGTFLAPGAVVNIGTRTGIGVIVNTLASVDHDCELEDGVHICPGAHLSGNVKVGAGSWIGVGAAVRQGIEIGAGVTIGAGAAVVSGLADGVTAVGVPARPI